MNGNHSSHLGVKQWGTNEAKQRQDAFGKAWSNEAWPVVWKAWPLQEDLLEGWLLFGLAYEVVTS